ncbi:MAG TPA: hypothetical protein VGR28_00160, partial [Candidatus Thermoplasmatota archaeon]|nr:hypothetical protein [Candidatus Thermoplasmatota archaeon]
MALTLLPERVPIVLAGLALLAVAAWLLALDPRRRLHRAFALLLVARAMVALLLAFSFTVDDYAGRLRVYFLLALPFAALYFGWVYRETLAGRARSRWVPLALLACAGAVEVAYLLDHGLFYATASLGGATVFAPGPLALAIPLKSVAFAGVACLFWRAGRAAVGRTPRDALFLAALGFALEPAFEATNAVVLMAAGPALGAVVRPPLPIFPALDLVALAAFALVVALAAGWSRALRGPAHDAAQARRALVALGAAAASGVVMVAVLVAEVQGMVTFFLPLNYAVGAVWTLAAPALVGYALARHRLFGVETQLRWTVKQSTLTAVFVGVFFVVSEGAEAVVSDRWGPVVGIAAAGVLLWALAPLQRAAERFAARAVPASPTPGQLSAGERAALYRDEARLAADDGRIGPRARELL